MTDAGKAVIFGIVAVALFASRDITTGADFQNVSILALSSIRGIAAGTLLILIFHKDLKNAMSLKNILGLVIASGLGYFANQLLLIAGLQMTSPQNGPVITQSAPLMLALLLIVTRQESFNRTRMISIGVAYFALAIYLWRRYSPVLDANFFGTLVIVASTLSFCAALIIAKKLVQSTSIGNVAGFLLFMGGLWSASISFADFDGVYRTALASSQSLLLLMYDIAIATALGSLLFFHAIKVLKLSTVGAFLFLTFPFTAGFRWIFAGESLSPLLLICSAVIAASCVFVVQLDQRS